MREALLRMNQGDRLSTIGFVAEANLRTQQLKRSGLT